jgi:two-component system, OmpR family, response regulator VanR
MPAGVVPEAPATILVVDDKPEVLAVFRLLLERSGYRFLGASQGLEAVALVRRRENPVAAVILDLGLADADGSAVCAELKAVADLPVILCSGLLAEVVQARAAEVEADGFLAKPFTKLELRQALQSVLPV